MTTRAKKRARKPPPAHDERRRFWRNAGLDFWNWGHWKDHRPDWDARERNLRLSLRTTGKAMAVLGGVALALINSWTTELKSENLSAQLAQRVAVVEANYSNLKEDIRRLQSYWGAPPPAYKP